MTSTEAVPTHAKLQENGVDLAYGFELVEISHLISLLFYPVCQDTVPDQAAIQGLI